MLHCLNCQTPNLESRKFCQKCGTPLVRRYLWAVQGGETRAGQLLADRYLSQGNGLFLDTKPTLLATNLTDLPPGFEPYLRLAPWQLHVPQVYDWLQEESAEDLGTVLLDQVPLCLFIEQNRADDGPDSPRKVEVQLLPDINHAWQAASTLRQLNWLWQMANLWYPLNSEKVAYTLLEPESLRIEGSLLRILRLNLDQINGAIAAPTLAQLGKVWLTWVDTAQPEIVPFMKQLCQQLIEGHLFNSEQLIEQLDGAIAKVSQAQTRTIQIATRTDQGPTRQRNEDACYPVNGTVQTVAASEIPFVIVCDGIGGHQGGNVASQLAIQTIKQRLQSFDPAALGSVALMVELEKAVCDANDAISQRNDSEQRLDRQRMGTTLVMGLVRGPELYITHVGDSRAYWINRWACHQVTLDDDVASREVRLGYSFYRQALQHPSAGSLVQALGMGNSNMLYPSVQRFILDEDSIFLFCSDGLSDNERVEEYWETEILPLLEGEIDTATLSNRLINLANSRNGHDNVTVGLIYCQVTDTQGADSNSVVALPGLSEATPSIPTAPPEPAPSSESSSQTVSTLKTRVVSPVLSSRRSQPQPLSRLLLLMMGLGLVGGLALLWMLRNGLMNQPTDSVTPSPTVSPSPTANSGPLPQLLIAAQPIPVFLTPPGNIPERVSRSDNAPELVERQPTEGLIPAGIHVSATYQDIDQERWVKLVVCQANIKSGNPAIPFPSPNSPDATPFPASPTSPGVPILTTGQTGWIRQADLAPRVRPVQNAIDEEACFRATSPKLAPPKSP